jgi:hypothetical protein
MLMKKYQEGNKFRRFKRGPSDPPSYFDSQLQYGSYPFLSTVGVDIDDLMQEYERVMRLISENLEWLDSIEPFQPASTREI